LQMLKKLSIVITVLAIACILTVALSGCSVKVDEFEGKNIVTFEMNGGIMSYSTSSTNTNVNFAYYPNTYILDPVEMPNYSISRNGYIFTGWYTSAECKPEEKWDFNTLFTMEKLQLFAGWEKALVHSYSVYYKSGTTEVLLGSYNVAPGDKFDDWREFGNERDGYTALGYYKDADCTEEWDYSYAHPGGDADCDIRVYVKHIEGEWKFAYDFETLKSALKTGNVYLMNNIDCGGEVLTAPSNFEKIFEGNGYTVSNFTVKRGGSNKTPQIAIFQTLSKGADIRNVTFSNVSYDFTGVRSSTATITVTPNVAALAVSMQMGAKVNGVTVSGKLTTNYTEGELDAIANKPFWFEGDADPAITAGIVNFTANVTVEVVTE